MRLRGKVFDINNLSRQNINRMFELMNMFYENANFDVFIRDLNDKSKEVNGVFSGDTIIHKDYWGSLELYKIFGEKYIDFSDSSDEFYWFLISKGYKTYRILPSFFYKFYPTYLYETPPEIKAIMDSFGKYYYPNEYNSASGVIEYKKVKDKLRAGVADITEDKLKNKHINFFKSINPDYIKGNDVVCLTSLKSYNIKPMIKRLISDGE